MAGNWTVPRPKLRKGGVLEGRAPNLLFVPDPWQEPLRGGYPDPELFSLSGLEQLRAMLGGAAPPPPVSRLTGMRLTDAGPGRATFELPLTRWLLTPQGAISIGPLVIPADAAMACAIQTALPPRTPFTTSELTLRMLAPARPGAMLTAHGRLIQARQTIALADAEVRDDRDELIAHGSTLCVIQPQLTGVPASAPGAASDGPGPATDGIPDPWQRPASGEVIPQGLWDERDGLEILRGLLCGELPPPPIHHLTGLTLTGAERGSATFSMPASEWLCAPARRRVQGGAVALLAEAALNGAIQTGLPPATTLAPVDLKVNYLRPLHADGRPALARGRVLHAGRRLAVASSEVLDAEQRPIAIATGSAMLLPGRPAALVSMPAGGPHEERDLT